MEPKLGLKENWKQFSLLVLINGFVGGMVGLERTILPQIAEAEFEIAAKTAILSFIVFFGISKSISNYYAGVWANNIGRKKLLVIGWLIGLPVPLILMYANHWNWMVLANIFLGINQGLTWSSTVVMKIDLVGEKNRGFAMGLNESAGYLSVGIVAFLTGWIGTTYGLRPYPFLLGLGFAIIGLVLSYLFVKDTIHHVNIEQKRSSLKKMHNVFLSTTLKHRSLSSITQAGLINNLNDGMIWGLFPLLLASKGFDLVATGKIVAIYPVIWGLGQLVTGKLADLYPKKNMLFLGMLFQGIAILLMIQAESFIALATLSVLLGIGTAVVYPTFLAAIADYTHPQQRSESIGVFRLWRDMGYAIGALMTGIIADKFGLIYAVMTIGLITVASSLVILFRMNNKPIN